MPAAYYYYIILCPYYDSFIEMLFCRFKEIHEYSGKLSVGSFILWIEIIRSFVIQHLLMPIYSSIASEPSSSSLFSGASLPTLESSPVSSGSSSSCGKMAGSGSGATSVLSPSSVSAS